MPCERGVVKPLKDLGLAGARSRAVGLGTSGGGGSVGLAGGGDEGNVVRVGKRSLGHAAQGLAGGRAGLLGVLLVGGEVEGDEENQVRAEGDDTREGSELLAGALAGVGEPGPVRGGEVGVRGEVDEAWRTC